MDGLDFGLRRRTAYSRVGFRSPFVWQSIRSYDDVSIGVILIALPHGPKTVTSKTLVRAGTEVYLLLDRLALGGRLGLPSFASRSLANARASAFCLELLIANEEMQLKRGLLERFKRGWNFTNMS